MELDDWGLSAEELDSLERDALKQIALLYNSSSSSSSSSSYLSSNTSCPYPQQQHSSAPFNLQRDTPVDPITEFCHDDKVGVSPLASRVLPESAEPKVTNDCLKDRPKLCVKFFLHASENIAAKFLYDQVLVGAFRKNSKASWNAKER